MSKAIDDVLAERARQIEVEGWTAEHDDLHSDGSLALAACCYASLASAHAEVCGDAPIPLDNYKRMQPYYNWPKSWSRSWWKPKSPRRDLVRAAALIIAEIERMDRMNGLPEIERNGKQWPVMGYGNIAISGVRNAADPRLAGIVYLKLPSARAIDEDCSDLYPTGSQTSDDDTLACIYFKDAASIDQTIDVLSELKATAFGEAEK